MVTVIARAEVAAGLKRRFASNPSLEVFRDSEALRALDAIFLKPPHLVAIDPVFAATSRGATLIARLRAEASLAEADVRLLLVDDQPARLAQVLEDSSGPFEEAVATHSRPLDWCGTRRAARFPILPQARAAVNGQPSQVVNLSASGVQVISPGRLRPTQNFKLTLLDDERELRLQAVVAWSTFQSAGSEPAYRAGAEFTSANPELIQDFCARYGSAPDRTFVVPEAERIDAHVESAPAPVAKVAVSGRKARGAR
jgi:hypothetical protein